MAESNRNKKQNVLFVVSHDISRDWFGCYGNNVHTPNIDELAAGGFLFPKHYCHMPLCGPSRANIFSGCRPDTTGRFDNHTYLPAFRERMGANFATLPEHFRNHGYVTQALDDIMHVTDHTKSADWDVTEEERSDKASWSASRWDPPLPEVPTWAPDDWTTAESMRIWVSEASRNVMHRRAHVLRSQGLDLIQNVKRWRGPATEAPDVIDNTYSTGMTTDKAVRFLEELKTKQPFFLAVAYSTTHGPWCAPKRYWDMYEPESVILPRTQDYPTDIPAYAPHLQNEPSQYYTQDLYDKLWQPTDEQILELRHGYFATVSFLDAQIGVLLQTLKRLGLQDDTVIVFTTDHGFSAGEHGHWHKMTNYEPDLSVPLIVRVPGHQNAGSKPAQLTEHVDIYPTLCELCGLAKPSFLEGSSLIPLLNDPNPKGGSWKQAVFSQVPRNPSQAPEPVMGYSMRTDRYRLIQWRKSDGAVDACELYDYEKDPMESRNLAADSEYIEILTDLKEIMEKGWQAQLKRG